MDLASAAAPLALGLATMLGSTKARPALLSVTMPFPPIINLNHEGDGATHAVGLDGFYNQLDSHQLLNSLHFSVE